MFTRDARLPLAWLGCTTLVFALAGCARHESDSPATTAGEGATSRLLATPVWELAPPSGRLDGSPFWRLPYPLAVGNSWSYDVNLRFTVVKGKGSHPPQTFQNALDVEITGVVQVGARTYFQQSAANPVVAAPPLVSMLRQDRSGLFLLEQQIVFFSPGSALPDPEALSPMAVAARGYVDRAFAGSPHQAAYRRAALTLAARINLLRNDNTRPASQFAGSPEAGELSLLCYPLNVGARWIVLDSPRFARIVEARDWLRVPAGAFSAWRLRVVSEQFGPDDRVRIWYSNAGLLRVSAHFEAEATDDLGNIVGRLSADSEQALKSLHLVEPGPPVMHWLGSTPSAEQQ